MTICRTLAWSAVACFLLGGSVLAEGITVHDARNRDVATRPQVGHLPPGRWLPDDDSTT